MDERHFDEGPVKIGEKIYDFDIDVYLPRKKDFGKIKFSEIASEGKWLILFFYPADFTFVCPTELAEIGEKYESIKEKGAELISISTDTQYVHMSWQDSEKLLKDIEYPMGADPAHKISRSFGVYDDATGTAFRGTFLIDPDMTLVASEVNYFSVGRNSEELLRKLTAFKHVRENPAHACPARWSPGEKTLVPGKDLVGKVSEALKK